MKGYIVLSCYVCGNLSHCNRKQIQNKTAVIYYYTIKKLELAIKKKNLESSYVVVGDIKWSNPITFENDFYIFFQN